MNGLILRGVISWNSSLTILENMISLFTIRNLIEARICSQRRRIGYCILSLRESCLHLTSLFEFDFEFRIGIMQRYKFENGDGGKETVSSHT